MQSMVKTGLIILSVAFAMAFFSGSAMAQGKALYTAKGCVTCHGPDGKAPILPNYPKLAGQNSQYIQDQLKAFKGQKRTSGQSALMLGFAASLSDADIKTIADYLSKVK